jgi:hypothetical protein
MPQAVLDKGGWTMAEGTTLTLYLAYDGASLTINRVLSLRIEGEGMMARTAKGETFAFTRETLFAVATDGEPGPSLRRAGFG